MGFQGLDQILGRIFERFPELRRKAAESQAVLLWPQIVGPIIAKNTRPILVKDGVLLIEVAQPAWKAELHYRKKQILDRLNQVLEEEIASKQKPPAGHRNNPSFQKNPDDSREAAPLRNLIKDFQFAEPNRQKPNRSNPPQLGTKSQPAKRR